jgi:3-deoxy-D-arabino-heptulosonate 7-phosphate (DAHP) synthase class II
MENSIQQQPPVIFARDVVKLRSSLNKAASVAATAVTKNAEP